MSEESTRAQKIREFLISKAPGNSNWASENTNFICPASLALVSELPQAEITSLFDGVFDSLIPLPADKASLQQMVINNARYAVSRLPDKDGNPQILPHINQSHIFGFGVEKSKFGVIEPSREYSPDSSFNKLTVANFGKGSNQAQQLTNMIWHLEGELASQISAPVAVLLVQKKLFYNTPKNSYCLTDLGKILLSELIAEYRPLLRPISAMKIEGKFNHEAQRFNFSAVVLEEVIARLHGQRVTQPAVASSAR